MSSTISRVMYQMIIYIDLLLPTGSIDPPKARRAAVSLLFGLSSDGVYICHCCYQQCGSLLHCHSALTSIKDAGGIFLLHFPWSHLHRTLSGILPCEARTFLVDSLSALVTAIICATHSIILFNYHRNIRIVNIILL